MSKELPLGYIECEYIYTDGTQYIDTGFIPSSETRAVLDIEPTADVVVGSGAAGVFGSRGNGTTNAINYFAIMANRSSQYRSDFGSNTSVLITVSPFQQRVTMDKNSNVVTINGESASVAWTSWTGLYPIYIFRVNNNGSPTSAQFFGKLYKCQLYNNGTLERDYVPCVNNEGVYGLWDKVYGVFVTSADPAHPLTGKWASPKTLAVSLSEIRHRMLAAIAPKIAIPNNEIWYTLEGTGVVYPDDTGVFGATLVSNTIVGDKGILKFDGDVTKVGNRAFLRCDYTSILLPKSVTSIGNQAFYECDYLVDVNIPNEVTSIGSYAFYNCNQLKSDIVIPNGITFISSYTFQGCRSLTKIVLPDTITQIYAYAFSGCKKLIDIRIPDGVKVIDTYAFHNTGITNIVIPKGVTKINNMSFYYCSNLKEITIHDGITQIGQSAFMNCSSLQRIYCERKTPPTGGPYMFDDISSNAIIYVPAGSGNAYKTAQYWSNYASMIVEM